LEIEDDETAIIEAACCVIDVDLPQSVRDSSFDFLLRMAKMSTFAAEFVIKTYRLTVDG
jgi:hypothetical protein